VIIGAGATVGEGDVNAANELQPQVLNQGITLVGRNSFIPEGAVIGRSVLVNSGRDESAFPDDKIVADGKTI
jgi:hypothetical protein